MGDEPSRIPSRIGRLAPALAALAVAGALAAVWIWLSSRPQGEVGERRREGGIGWMVDVAPELGMTRPNVTGSPERLYIFENIGSGAAIFDADGDGRLDLFISNAGEVRVEDGRRIRLAPGPGVSLYRQRPQGDFEELAAQAGIRFEGWGTGVAVGDIDNDGDLDLYLCAFGPNRLYINDGAGGFSERSREAGVDHPGFASSAVFTDYDRDGFLDLYVANYVVFDLENPPNDGAPCRENGVPISCGPTMHPPAPDVLYRNRGDGTFEDATSRAGMGNQEGPYGLGVAAGDLDRDGWPDIYVANDTTANFLWRNRGDGSFEDVALFAGAALSENAQGQSGMGIDLADADADGWLDLHVSNYSEESNAYYQSLGDGTFADRSVSSGLADPSFMSLGWGTKFLDWDQDGILDLAVANGHVHPRAAELGPGQSFRQRLALFHGTGGGRFEAMSRDLGEALSTPRNHRGLAVGDIDGDGDLDLLVTVLDGPPLLISNRAARGRSIAFMLEGSRSNREGIGARLELHAGGRSQTREVSRGGSYLSASDAAVHFGVGDARRIERIEIGWPSGKTALWENLETGRLYRLRESGGAAEMVRVFRGSPGAGDR